MIIYVDINNFVCGRYPKYIDIKYGTPIDVSEEIYNQSLSTAEHYCWKYIDNKLVPYKYEEENTEEIIANCKQELDVSDYKVIKALEKLLLSDTDLHKTRQALRDKINELEQTNNGG